ncbi:MAG: GDP-L-fucose synthase [Fibrobacterales bacterium]
MEKSAKIYVAGHMGLVGSALVRNLKSKGYTNIIGRSFLELDLRDQKVVAEFFEQEKPDYVILAAAKVGGIVANNTYRADFIYENLQIQNNVIHQCYVSGVKKLLFLGSSCIYPKLAPQPMPEQCLLTSELEYTNEPYAIAKIAGLKMCEAYNVQYGTNFIAVMPTNLYGENDNFDLEKSHVLPALIRKMHLAKLLEAGDEKGVLGNLGVSTMEEAQETLSKYGVTGDSVTIWGTGKPMREFLYSDDMADACVHLLESIDFQDIVKNLPTGQVINTHINIGTGIDLTIGELAQKVKEIVGFGGKLVFDTDKPDGTMKKLQDVTMLHKLGWKHTIELDDGIGRLYKWYTDRI